MAAVAAVSELIRAPSSLHDAADGALRLLGEVLECDAGSLVGIAGSKEPSVHLVASWRAQPGRVATYEVQGTPRRWERGRDVAGRAWETKLPAVLDDVPAGKEGDEAVVRASDGIAGWLAIPLIGGDRVWGILELVRRAPFRADAELRRGALVVGRLLGEFAGRQDTFNALQRTKRELADLADNAPLGINVLSVAGLIQRTNRGQLEMLGYGREEFVGRPWADFMDKDEGRALWSRLLEARPNEAGIKASARLKSRDGTWRSVELLSTAVWGTSGELLQVRLVARDVTELLLTAAALEVTAGRHRRLLEGVGDYSLHALDPEGRIISWNRGAERLYGFAEYEILGHALEQMFTAETDRSDLPSRMLRLAIDEGRCDFECLRRRKDGSSFWAAINYTCARDDKGAATEISVVTHDITQHRRLEALRGRSVALEQANRKVIDSAREHADLIRQIVNTLETPFESLRTAVGRVRERAGSGPTLEVATILSAAEQLARAVHALSSTGAGMAEQLAAARLPVDLMHVAVGARDLVREQAADRRVRIEIDVDPELADVTVDAAVLAQVASNLLAYGVWASRERGRVTLRALPEGSADFRLEVEDSGIGLSQGEAAALFFAPAAGGAEEERALGLPATKHMVEALGGRVGVHSAPGRGSVVFVVLPRAPHDRPEQVGVEATPRRVLVVSENLATRASLCWTLGRTHHEVIPAAGADEALHIARERRCDVVTVDLLLEAMPPTDFVARLRAEGLSRDASRLIATIGAPGSGVVGIVAADLLPRPVPGDRLFAALERAHVPPGHGSRILVVDGDIGACKSICRTLEVLDYAAVPEVDAHGALKACAEQPPAAILLSPFIQGMDVFSFLQHLRASERSRSVPRLLLVPRPWGEGQLEALRTAAEEAAYQGSQRQLEQCIDET